MKKAVTRLGECLMLTCRDVHDGEVNEGPENEETQSYFFTYVDRRYLAAFSEEFMEGYGRQIETTFYLKYKGSTARINFENIYEIVKSDGEDSSGEE